MDKHEAGSVGIVRRLDDLGRIVIPKEILRRFQLPRGAALSVFTDDRSIILSPLTSSCIFCAAAESLEYFRGKPVCSGCRAELRRRSRRTARVAARPTRRPVR